MLVSVGGRSNTHGYFHQSSNETNYENLYDINAAIEIILQSTHLMNQRKIKQSV